MSRATVRRAAGGGVLALMMIAQALAASPAGPPDQQSPPKQLFVNQSGVLFRLGPFVLGRDWIAMTVLVENRRDDSVRLAATSNPKADDTLQASLSDNSGKVCTAAADPAGIETIQPPGPPSAAAAADSMTRLAPRAHTQIVLQFEKCSLSRTSPLSFSGEFAVMRKDQPPSLIDIRFWGIEQRTTTG
jgi:hypothetical protein